MPQTNLTEIEVEIVVEKSVRKTLMALGIDLDDTRDLKELQADFAFMRRQRKSSEKLADWIRHSAVVVLIGGVLAILWQGILAAVRAKSGAP